MDSEKLVIWGGVALLAYVLYSNYAGSLGITPVSASGTVSSLPSANAAGNEFSCATGTHYVDYETSQASGGGYCE